MSTAIYPGTFDPFTLGHYDLVRRAAKLFDKIYIAVALSTSKHPLFSLEERIELIEQVMADDSINVEVVGFQTLMVDMADKLGVDAIIRGLRAVSDFEYEVQLASMNRQLKPDIETVYLSPAEEYTAVSSTLIKDIARHGGDISRFTHPIVTDKLTQRFKVQGKN